MRKCKFDTRRGSVSVRTFLPETTVNVSLTEVGYRPEVIHSDKTTYEDMKTWDGATPGTVTTRAHWRHTLCGKKKSSREKRVKSYAEKLLAKTIDETIDYMDTTD